MTSSRTRRRAGGPVRSRRHSDAPDPVEFDYGFERLADVVEGFCQALGLDRFVMYVFDYGAPVGFRLATRHPEWIAGLVVQNANAYDEGLSPAARAFVANHPGVEGAEDNVRALLTPVVTAPSTRAGPPSRRPCPRTAGPSTSTSSTSPAGRRSRPSSPSITTPTSRSTLNPRWQECLREHQPPTLIVWGRNDPFFTEAGARAYLRDVPGAELHMFDTGHFALEENLAEIAALIASYLAAHGERLG